MTVSASARNMTAHMGSCAQVQRSVGCLADSLADCSDNRGVSTTVAEQTKAKVYPNLSREESRALDQAFAAAVHRTGTAFSLFEHPAWREFFDLLHLPWTPPVEKHLSTSLLSDVYMTTMVDMARALHSAPAITIGVDGATNVLSRSMSNVIAHDPRPWFVEHLGSDLKKETCQEVTARIKDSITRLHGFINQEVVFAFVSDSCNLMRAVRRELQADNSVAFAYGCSAHALNNLCEDIAKLPETASTLRQAVYVSKTVKNQGLLFKIYAQLCEELLSKAYAMVLYSASRWSSINSMFKRLSTVKRPVTAVVTAVLNERMERGIDEAYELPTDFSVTVMDGDFWRRVRACESAFEPICQCIGVLEGDAASVSAAYASFLYVLLHIHRTFRDEQRSSLRKRLEYRWGRIYSPVHALAFCCDPFYRDFRRAMAVRVGADSLGLGQGDIMAQCRLAIELLTRNQQGDPSMKDVATVEFMRFCVEEEAVVSSWEGCLAYQPRMIWAQAEARYPALSKLLVKEYSVPASTAGVERQHKVSKRIHSASRNRMASGKVQQQVAVAHNAAVSAKELAVERHKFEHIIANDNCVGARNQVDLVVGDEQQSEANDELLESLSDAELAEQERLNSALALASLIDMPSEMLFPDEFGD